MRQSQTFAEGTHDKFRRRGNDHVILTRLARIIAHDAVGVAVPEISEGAVDVRHGSEHAEIAFLECGLVDLSSHVTGHCCELVRQISEGTWIIFVAIEHKIAGAVPVVNGFVEIV